MERSCVNVQNSYKEQQEYLFLYLTNFSSEAGSESVVSEWVEFG